MLKFAFQHFQSQTKILGILKKKVFIILQIPGRIEWKGRHDINRCKSQEEEEAIVDRFIP